MLQQHIHIYMYGLSRKYFYLYYNQAAGIATLRKQSSYLHLVHILPSQTEFFLFSLFHSLSHCLFFSLSVILSLSLYFPQFDCHFSYITNSIDRCIGNITKKKRKQTKKQKKV